MWKTEPPINLEPVFTEHNGKMGVAVWIPDHNQFEDYFGSRVEVDRYIHRPSERDVLP